MDIQQLNGSGQQIWVFFTTAVAVLLLTGGSWLGSNRLATHKAILWYKERAAAKEIRDQERKSQEYGLLHRIAILVWLVRNGHSIWTWKSGAWAAVLTNNRTMVKSDISFINVENGRPACDYVSTFSSPSESDSLWAFTLEPAYMATWSTPLR